MARKCQARTRSGNRCGGFAIDDSNYCFSHEPKMAHTRAAARKRGGYNRRKSPINSTFPELDPEKISGLVSLVKQVLRETWALENSLNRSRTIGYLAQVQRSLIESSELHERLSAVETVLSQRDSENENEKT